ncbi:MAG TPA: 6,7-dimethyl-8-ribityllumazine synthase [Gammaproteobacteria bacterium]|nr:6,7-dimethyl-8-ribityllumazine synthase [Gammaproteobacteria bacterium]
MNYQANQPTQPTGHQYDVLANGKRIAFIEACWHSDIVGQARDAFFERCEALDIDPSIIDVVDVPGSLEIPLQCKLLANSGKYAVIVATGLIVDGGIYRHDFVASSVLDGMMQVQLDTEVPILSVVLTPHHFLGEEHEAFFFKHFRVKGAEGAEACARTLENLALTM